MYLNAIPMTSWRCVEEVGLPADHQRILVELHAGDLVLGVAVAQGFRPFAAPGAVFAPGAAGVMIDWNAICRFVVVDAPTDAAATHFGALSLERITMLQSAGFSVHLGTDEDGPALHGTWFWKWRSCSSEAFRSCEDAWGDALRAHELETVAIAGFTGSGHTAGRGFRP